MNKRRKFSIGRLSLRGGCYLSLALSSAVLIGLILYISIEGANNLSWDFLFGEYKGDSPSILPALLGTLSVLFISLVFAVPIGIGTAIFLSEYAPKKGGLVEIIRLATETLAGIPSIVYGLFGYLLFVDAMGMGYSLLGGGLTLFLMILPLIVRSVEEALIAVPNSLREASLALGASRYKTIFKVVLPAARNGIVTSLILSSGRVISESAVLLLTVGMMVNRVPSDLLSSGTTLALDIYYFASYGYPAQAAATAFVLLILVIVLDMAAFFIGRLGERKSHGK